MAFTVSTKPSKDGAAKQTVLTITFDNPQAERALAIQAAVVKLQGAWRKNGIPEKAEVKMSELMPGSRINGSGPVTFEGAKALLPTLTPEQKAELLAQLRAE